MTADSEQSLVTISSLFREKFPQTDDQPTTGVSPLGIISYDQGNRLVLLGSNMRGSLVTQFSSTPENFSSESLIGGEGRFRDLSHLDTLAISQIDLSKPVVSTHRSIRTRPSVAIQITSTDPYQRLSESVDLDIVDQNKGTFTLMEREFLPVFTGERGGIVVMEGANLPEENALLIEKRLADKRHGLLFFFHPSDKETVDSVEGLYQFIKSLNKEFQGSAEVPYQKEVLTKFGELSESGRFRFDSDVRRELFITQLIALARLSHEHPQYRNKIDGLLPSQPQRRWYQFGSQQNEIEDLTHKANEAIDSLLSQKTGDDQIDQNTLERDKQSDQIPVLNKIKSEELRVLRTNLDAYFGSTLNPAMKMYIKFVFEKLGGANETDDLNDLQALIDEMKTTQLYQTHAQIPLRHNVDRYEVDLDTRFRDHFGTMVDIFYTKLIEKKMRASKKK
jgi:hypothetical protein